MGFMNEKLDYVLEVAVRSEKKAMEVYWKAAKKFTDPEISEAFELLAREEEKHLEKYREMLTGIADYRVEESYPGRTESFFNDMVLISTRTFKQLDESVEEGGLKGVIELAIKAEMESILFYSDLLFGQFSEADKKIIHSIIKAEKKHVSRLNKMLEQNSPGA